MDISRRDFLRISAATGGTALSGLVGSGVNLGPAVAKAQELRIRNAKATPSVCPYCSVGCATLVHTIDGKIVNIEGDPRSPHNEGTLCPKGAAIFQLHVNPNRPTQVLHRAPGAADWEVWDLNRAMDRVAELVKKTATKPSSKNFTTASSSTPPPRFFLSAAPPSTTSGITSSRNFCAASASCRSRIRRAYDTAPASPVWGRDWAAAQRPCIRAAWPTPTASS